MQWKVAEGKIAAAGADFCQKAAIEQMVCNDNAVYVLFKDKTLQKLDAGNFAGDAQASSPKLA